MYLEASRVSVEARVEKVERVKTRAGGREELLLSRKKNILIFTIIKCLPFL